MALLCHISLVNSKLLSPTSLFLVPSSPFFVGCLSPCVGPMMDWRSIQSDVNGDVVEKIDLVMQSDSLQRVELYKQE